ncbi:MAG: DUF6036 family nucleotidyltransferase [Gemmatimonadaceae bacterium]
MRELANRALIERFMDALGNTATSGVRIYLVGGTTAVLMGWRASTIDVDMVMQPEDETLLRAIPGLKNSLRINVELVSPAHFIPVPPGWEGRSTFIRDVRRVAFYHFDLYAQALAKVERGHRQDLEDVRAMLERSLIDPRHALEYFQWIEPALYRFPAIDPASFRRGAEEIFAE